MGRRLAEATKACRTRRTCGEIFLRFFLVLVEAAVFFLADVLLAVAPFADVRLAGVVLTGASLTDTDGDELDWAAAGCKKLSQSRKKVPAKTTTAKRRTQTLPTAGSWHP